MTKLRRPTTRQVFEKRASQTHSAEVEIERDFFTSLLLPNGTFKTTDANRLDDVDQAFSQKIGKIADRPIQVMDVAVSSGLTTFDWYEHLRASGICCQITATDVTIYASLVSWFSDKLSVLIDVKGNILHVDAFGNGLLPTKGLRGALLHPRDALFAAVIRTLFRAMVKIDNNLPPLYGDVRLAAKGRILTCEPLTLVTGRLDNCQDIRMMEDDLLAENPPQFNRAFHAVRAANILNRVYFSDAEIVRMVRTLIQRLKDYGYLIICRTIEGTNNATVFQLTPDRKLFVSMRLGEGSEIEGLIREKGLLVSSRSE